MLFWGSIVALVTPFEEDYSIDYDSLEKLIEWHIKEGTHAIVPCGTTGESATLSMEEHKEVVEFVTKRVAGKLPVIAGAGSNSTQEAKELARHAEKVGANAVLVITPYYNKPTPEGLFLHFKTVANSISIPVILYNVPSRTGINMAPSVVKRLIDEVENIVGIKEASGNLRQISELRNLCSDRLTILSGDDFTSLPSLAIGARGVISVVANVLPQHNSKLIQAYFSGDLISAQQEHYYLFPLMEALFWETNPIPVKAALAMMKKIRTPTVRLPLAPLSSVNYEKLGKLLKEKYSLI